MTKLVPLRPSFYEAPVVDLARALVGAILVVGSERGVCAGRIVETEAYRGPEDLAAHSRRGLRTPRTEVMFGPAGHAYVYLLYGTSWAFNVVAGPVGAPHAVLVRAVEPVSGLELMEARRGVPRTKRELTNGPGKLTHALGIDRSHYGRPLFDKSFFIAEGFSSGKLGASARVNVDYAGAWAKRRWRFYERGNRYVSVAPR